MDHLRKKFGNTAVLRAVGLKGDQKKKSENQ
jgi:hypothetical protein